MDNTLQARDYQNISGVKQAQGTWGTGSGSFYGPTTVVIEDVTKNIFITDAYNGRVQVFSENLIYLNQFGAKSSGWPWGICIRESLVFVMQLENPFFNQSSFALLSIFTLNGTLVTSFKFEDSDRRFSLSQPRGIDVERDNTLYICDKGNNRVRAIMADLPCLRDFLKVSAPLDIKCHHGAYIVLSCSPGLVMIFSSDRYALREYTNNILRNLKSEGFLALDKLGNILISIGNEDKILVLSWMLEYIHTIKGEFNNIRGLAVDENSRIINVCEKNESRLKIL